jgi:hypothetical protein
LKKLIKIKEETEVPKSILGISVQEPDYKIAWELNTILSVELKKLPDKILTDNKSDSEISIPFYYYKSDDNVKYFFIQNNFQGYTFLSGIKHIDFILFVLPEIKAKLVELKNTLVKTKRFTGAFLIELNKRQENKLKLILKK